MTVGFTCGAFDLFHAGHIAMLQEAKSVCDYLIVGIKVNPAIDQSGKNKPIQSIVERQIQVRACKYVDETIVYETEKDLMDLLTILDIDIRIVGQDHANKPEPSPRDEICQRKGIEIYCNKRDHRFSTTELRERIKNA